MKRSSPNRKIASNLLLRGGEFVTNPIVEVDDRGCVVAVEVGVEGVDRSPQTEFYSGIMVAGFVNAHCHLELSYLRGAIEPSGGFASFGSSIGALRGGYSDEERAKAMVRADVEMLREGVVGVGDIVNGESSFGVKGSSKIRYRSFAEVFGLRATDSSAVDGLLPMGATLTPHSLYSLNDRLFRDIVESSDQNVPLSIHFMESPSEMELFRGVGAMKEWYDRAGFECDFLHYGSPAERLIASVPADRAVMLVHNCCVTQRDIDLIMGHFTAPVYWVLCPRSNRYISNIKPPYELLRGLNIAIGTDSLASNWSLSILDELREIDSIPLAERLTWATKGGAEALKLSGMGEIEEGMSPGINILSGVDYTSMELTSNSRIRRII